MKIKYLCKNEVLVGAQINQKLKEKDVRLAMRQRTEIIICAELPHAFDTEHRSWDEVKYIIWLIRRYKPMLLWRLDGFHTWSQLCSFLSEQIGKKSRVKISKSHTAIRDHFIMTDTNIRLCGLSHFTLRGTTNITTRWNREGLVT